MNEIPLVGKKFGRLTVVERCQSNGNEPLWICRCDCGKLTQPITGGNLRSGHTKSCGCLRTKHGKYNTRLYGVWHGMKKRCYCKTSPPFKNYGGRGIAVCEEWKTDFSKFEKWAFDNGYDENAKQGECTLDRIDVNGNYCPDNCRWVDMKTQQNNRRNNISSLTSLSTHKFKVR